MKKAAQTARLTEALEIRYRSYHESARLSARLARRASAPLLVYPHERWAKAKVKLLIVGQETLTWRYEPEAHGAAGSPIRTFRDFSAAPDGVDSMWQLYRWYRLGRQNPKMNSVFWRGFRVLDQAVNKKEDSALWTNLFKVNVQGSVMENCTRPEIARLHKAQDGLLRHEIAVLRPDVVVFFTGPRYDAAIRAEFPGVEFQPFNPELPLGTLALLQAPGLPAKTVRSYHPEYLQRSRQWALMSLIAEWASTHEQKLDPHRSEAKRDLCRSLGAINRR